MKALGSLLEEQFALYLGALGELSCTMARVWMRKMVHLRLKQGRLDEAHEYLDQVVSLSRVLQEHSARDHRYRQGAGSACLCQGRLCKVRKHIKKALELVEQIYGGEHPKLTDCLAQYAYNTQRYWKSSPTPRGHPSWPLAPSRSRSNAGLSFQVLS